MADAQALVGSAGASRKAAVVGWILGAPAVLLMLMSSSMKLARVPQVLEGWAKNGYPPGTLLPIAITELACALLYLWPRTAVLGAILVTGFLGGATDSHVRAGESYFVVPVLLGMLAWGGLFLRDPRLRALLPLRRDG